MAWAPEPLVASFDRQAITGIRHAVSGYVSKLGLHGLRLDGFVLAVNEIMTNAVRHGGGKGRLRLWHSAGSVWCEVRDDGTGAQPAGLEATQPPPVTADGGRGLWLARQLCDLVTVDAGRAGTTVRLCVLLP
jgi:serine/threonine-protein kinase RsbW